MNVYIVTLTSDRLTGPFVADLLASSPEAAGRRVTLAAVHTFGCAELLHAKVEVQVAVCGWFAMCGEFATGYQAHPVLGEVPICDRCKGRANG